VLRFLVRRVLLLVPVLWGAATLAFLGLHMVPGGIAQAILGEHATAAAVARIEHQLGLDRPLYVQYGHFLIDSVLGRFGISFRTHDPVFTDIAAAFPYTLQLSAAALLIALVVGVPAGVAAAVRRGSWADTAISTVVLVGVSMPVFWTGLLLIILGAAKLGIFPVSGALTAGVNITPVTGLPLLDALLTGNGPAFSDALMHLVLPAITLALFPLAFIGQMTRSSLLEVLSEDFVRTARAKGLSERTTIFRHGLRAALIPVVTVVGLQLGGLLSGAILTETVFAIPGMGYLTVNAIEYRDYPVVEGVVVVTVAIFVLVNLVVDFTYALVDPRVRYA
jgi:ABC-type dipeptide/oligopeptide/nickel transport system permease component